MGLCPKCDRWFACDDFFNPAVAMPCCPHCRLAPARLDYRFPRAAGTVAVADARAPVGRPAARLAGAMAAAAGAHAQHAHVALVGSQKLSLAHDVLDPPVLDAAIPGVDLGVATRPAGPLLGGATYGAYPSTEGEWTVMLADVAGHGNDAAAKTAVVRNSVHGLAKAVRGPGLMLALLNQLLIEEPAADRLCSAVMVRLHTPADEEPLRATVARAGHPYPLVRKADGRVQVVQPHGMLLGVTTTLSLATETVVLEPGDALVLYTDGLVEGWDRAPAAGTRDLIDVLQDAPCGSADELARHLLDAPTGPGQPGGDDATVLVVKAADVPAAATSPPARSHAGDANATAAIDHHETTIATVITVAGTLNADPMTRLLDMLAAQYIHGEVIIDLSGVMMTNPPAIRSLVARLSAWTDTTTLRIVCDRLTARRLLRKWGAADLPVDASMANALDALGQHTLHGRGGVGTANPHESQ